MRRALTPGGAASRSAARPLARGATNPRWTGSWRARCRGAEETARIIAPALGDLPVRIEPELVEHRPGDADGIRFEDFASRFGAFDVRREPDRPLAPGAESLRQFYERTRAVLARIVRDNQGSTVCIVCHGGVIDNAFRDLLAVGIDAPFDLWTINTSITEFRLRADAGADPGRWTLMRYNDAAHLEGLPDRSTP